MLLSAMSVLVVAQSSSEIPEGLMNNPVLLHEQMCSMHCKLTRHINRVLVFKYDHQIWIISVFLHTIYDVE